MKRAVICNKFPHLVIPQLDNYSIMIINPDSTPDRLKYLLDNADWSLLITDSGEQYRDGGDYPNERMEILIGSDGSDDGTVETIRKLGIIPCGNSPCRLLIREKRRWCFMSLRDLACRREREEERHEENRWSLKTEMRKKRMAAVHEQRQDMKSETLSSI